MKHTGGHSHGTRRGKPTDPCDLFCGGSSGSGSGLISINAASAKELEALPGVGQVTAEKIIRYREEHGRFSSKEELKKVPPIGESRYKKIADKITL